MIMRNRLFFLQIKRPFSGLAILLLLVPPLLPTACRNTDRLSPVIADGQNAMAAGSPEAVAGRFITACMAGDWAKALDFLVPEMRVAVLNGGGGNPCSQVSAGAAPAVIIANERVGNTSTVTFNWPAQDSDATVEYQLLLTEIEGAWRIFSDHKTRHQPSPTQIPPAPTVALPGSANIRATESGE
jgi:hypothetical protein